LLNATGSIELVGEAGSAAELIRLTRKIQPEVLLVDVKMPHQNGIEATKLIKKEFPHIGVVGLSTYDEEYLVLEMLNAGAKGYLLKNAVDREILAAIKAVYKDDIYYCKEITNKLSLLLSKGGVFAETQELTKLFNEVERDMIKLVCAGLSSKQIAIKIGYKTRTVEHYRDVIMKKMQVGNVAEFVVFAVKYRLYSPDADNNMN
jgi:DNA-binding NarL/FixJ family response regulator